MPLANILKGGAFRLALQLLAIFISMLLIGGALLVNALSTTLENELRAQVEEEAILLGDIYRDQGRQGLISSIAQLSQKNTLFSREIGLFDEHKLHLAGQVSLLPNFIGWRKVALQIHTRQSQQQYHTRVMRLSELSLVIGRSSQSIDHTRRQLIGWLLALGIALSIGAIGLGYIASAKSYRKLKHMSEALAEVAKGELAKRIDVASSEDQIDLIAKQVNGHLAHLARLVTGIQTSATAIAHDLKTPLSHAQIALYEARDQAEQAQQSTVHIDNALEKLQQLNQTFDTVLRISRIQLQTDQSKFKAQSLAPLINNVIDLLEPLAQQAGIDLQIQIDALEEAVHCDSAMVQQMVINIVNNAIVHCPSGTKVWLHLSASIDQVTLLVRDNGPGIPESRTADIFDPFTRLSSSRTTPGNGLGLALVKAIAEQHSAHICLSDARPGLQFAIIFDKV